jgi:hypothetical protein
MPTVPRPHDEDYLLTTLTRLQRELPSDPSHPLYGRVLVLVVYIRAKENVRDTHVRFEEARTQFASSPYFEFTVIDSPPQPPGLGLDDLGSANFPGYRVRKQTRDLAQVVRLSTHRGGHYLFLEDDMLLCGQGLLSLQYAVTKAQRYHPDWIALRASYGMNGIVMHDKDLTTFASYLETHQSRRPPDHLVVEWFAGETRESKAYRGSRQNVGFKYNLFEHIGLHSTLRADKAAAFPGCYDTLVEPVLFQVEAWSSKDCPHDDIWPCDKADKRTSLDLRAFK